VRPVRRPAPAVPLEELHVPSRITPCPDDSQKCVSTLNTTGYPAFEPVPYSCSAEEALQAVEAVVADFPRTKVTTREPGYLATTFTTAVFRFTDTVEFELDDEAKVVHFRSESVPYAGSDLGANRKRMTAVRAALVERLG
jgi:uncharacterized protein (DUF1499 family)